MKGLHVAFSIVIIFISFVPCHAQNIYWNTLPERAFVYRINNKEAQKFLTGKISGTDVNKLLHTQVDTFFSGKEWTRRPVKGHFLTARVVANELKCSYVGAFPYQVFLLKEYNALALQVVDLEGNVREDARVKLRLRRIRIDPQTKTYRVENGWVYGSHDIVTVELDGFRSVFNIEKHDVPAWYGGHYYNEGPSFYSYLITDKNRYRPGEKVRFKSYALSGSRIPLHRELQLRVVGDDQQWYRTSRVPTVARVTPHRPGSYAGEFQLHDSLKLKLDKAYTIQLVDRGGRIVASTNFRYEDYELDGSKLEVNLSSQSQYHPAGNKLAIACTDANGFLLKDATASIVVLAQTARETFQPVVILKDTLLFKEVSLDPKEATIVDIPPDIFPKANVGYNVHVTVTTTENRRIEKTVGAEFYYSQYELTSRFSNDSIVFEMLDNGREVSRVPMKLSYNGRDKSKDVLLPYREKINATISSISLEGENVSRNFSFKGLYPRLEIEGGIEQDSFKVHAVNPQQLEISWYVYQGSDLLKKGFGKEMKYDTIVTDRTRNFYVELLYTFGGEDRAKQREYKFHEDRLSVSLDVPERAYPGQEVEALVRVTNERGDPVKGVDITAFGVNSKLKYRVPDLPYYGDDSNPRSKQASYSKSDITSRSVSLPLEFERWNAVLDLDTMKFYQFAYPRLKPFVHEVSIGDSTQFAPFVMKDGVAQQVHVIEVNLQPVYFSWVKQPQEYSFYVPGDRKCSVSLRLFDRVLLFDSLSFGKGKKTIMSIDLDHLPRGVKVLNIPPRKTKGLGGVRYYSFARSVVDRYTQYLSSFLAVPGDAYLERGNRFVPLFSARAVNSYGSQIIVGPLNPALYKFTDPFRHVSITYRHRGGFLYSFEDNVVYQQDVKNLVPGRLYGDTFNAMDKINDLVMTKARFLTQPGKEVWHPRALELIDGDMRVNVRLPAEEAASGFAKILFENTQTKEMTSPCRGSNGMIQSFSLPRGLYNVIVMYNNFTYLRMDGVQLQSRTQVIIDLNAVQLHDATDDSRRWMTVLPSCYKESTAATRSIPMRGRRSSISNIWGTVYDEENTPLPGVNVVIKGTIDGTVTDEYGHFELETDDAFVTLVFTFIGLTSKELEVETGSEISVTMQEDVAMLQEVVVVGYGSSRSAALMGAVSTVRGQASVVPDDIKTEQADIEDRKDAERRLYNDLLALKTIRSNFTDVAFWEPKLYTDRAGESRFKIKYPDDITRWEGTVYAMNRRLQTGTGRKTVRSYKPIVAELFTPQFLTKGDSSNFGGRVSNYTDDKNIVGKVTLGDTSKEVRFSEFNTDHFPVHPLTTDSLTSRYVFTRDDGYTDGEERKVPVVEQGTERAEGTLQVLASKQEIHLKANANEVVTVEIMARPLDIFAGEVRHLLDYRYDCNEQLASKLIGLLDNKLLMRYEGKEFKYDKDINKIIDRLLKNQNSDFLWSWWGLSPATSYWMSAHVLNALLAARDAGYVVALDIENIKKKVVYRMALVGYTIDDVDLLHALAGWNTPLNYSMYVNKLDSMITKAEVKERDKRRRDSQQSFLREKFLLQEVRQLAHLPYQRDTLLRYKKDGIVGDVRFSDSRQPRYWYCDDLMVNAIAYRIARRDSSLHDLLVPMQMYFLSRRANGDWNTYYSSNIVNTVLRDLIGQGATKDESSRVTVSGKVNTTVNKFPYKVELRSGEELVVRKESGLPVYLMQYKTERVTTATAGVEGFEIRTWWNTGTTDKALLEAGKPATLTVEVKLKKEADLEHVMLEIPIPGACSYADKEQPGGAFETHREYFWDRAVIFSERVTSGTYRVELKLLPRFTGRYFVNPSRVSLMYFPVVNANTDLEIVRVK